MTSALSRSDTRTKNRSLQIANDALYGSFGDEWRKEIDPGPIDPEPGDILFNEEELSPGVNQLGFEWLVRQLMINNPEIAGDPSFTVGGSKGNKTNKKIIRSGDANAPNATDFMKIRNLGPAMFPIKKAQVNYGKEMPPNYRKWSEDHLKNYNEKAPGWLDRMKIHTKNYPTG
jgi:hypothetical protein